MRICNAQKLVEFWPPLDGVLAEVHGEGEQGVEGEAQDDAVTFSHDGSYEGFGKRRDKSIGKKEGGMDKENKR